MAIIEVLLENIMAQAATADIIKNIPNTINPTFTKKIGLRRIILVRLINALWEARLPALTALPDVFAPLRAAAYLRFMARL